MVIRSTIYGDGMGNELSNELIKMNSTLDKAILDRRFTTKKLLKQAKQCAGMVL